MIPRILICIAIASIFTAIIIYTTQDHTAFVTYYEKVLRGHLFSGFLTTGGFLLSLKIFIVIKLKDSVYDDVRYREIFDKNKRLDPSLSLYKPLQNLSHFLFWAVLSSILAATAQLTIGLSSNFYLAITSIWLSIFALSILIISLLLIKSSLNKYFSFIEDSFNSK